MRKINTFWNWFQDNNQNIKNVFNETPKNQKHIFFWINKHLHYNCKEIDFIIVFPKKPTDKSELIITANGNPTYFKQVTDLVDNAPKLRTWKFTAFIQPTDRIDKILNGLDHPYILPEITLKTSDSKFLPLSYVEESKKIDIIVYLKNFNIHCDTKTWKQALYIIIQDLLGEKSLYENINFIQLAQMPEAEDIELIHLYDLQYYLDDINASNRSK
ncbi:hypothetical protein [Flavobacterium sp.]|uniref:hypothetical protein n=1 Tax=Flavobacterium sp. TaxID=239 RepID=UPI00286E79BB|nr:hypothetical protein [Flavobacterium sp.]